jgi:predicted cupin superfamily sugar epimerase
MGILSATARYLGFMTAEDVKRTLGLRPHPCEGGWYVRTWEAEEFLATEAGARRTSTAIYYLLEPGTFSEMHRLKSDEVFHHYLGGPVEMLQLRPDGSSERVVIGKDLMAGERPQVAVRRDVWQGSRLVGSEGFALLGCTVSPGFEFEDYDAGERAALTERWPEWAEMIVGLTR